MGCDPIMVIVVFGAASNVEPFAVLRINWVANFPQSCGVTLKTTQ